jgi:hypothetical protein
MRKIYLYSFFFLFLYSCGVRQTQETLSTGDYDGAIRNAVDALRSRKEAKGKQDYIYILEEAFAKAKERDLQNINFWIKETNPSNAEQIYNTYLQMHERQELIKPILPLKLIREKRNAIFPFENYSDQIINSKNALSKHLYDNAKNLLASNIKLNYRKAFDDLNYLNDLNPNYKDVLTLIEEARLKGTDFVSVSTKNETNMVIPIRLQNDLLDFSTFGLNDKWTIYHSNRLKDVTYDYGMIVNFREINISPEQIKEKEFVKEKQIKDGTKPLLNAQGQQVKDSLGNVIMVDNFKTIRINIYEFRQFKSVQVKAKVDYLDLRTNQLIETFPLSSEFVFEHIYATYNGDKRACDDNYLTYFDKRSVPFPSNEQMVYDSGEDLKAKLKDIINRNRFRR